MFRALQASWDSLKEDLLDYRWWELGAIATLLFACYGLLVTFPTAPYDFAAAKGDGFQVFLTYFFMRRWMQGIVAAFFHDFSPLWNASIGLAALFVALLLLGVLCKRAGISRGGRFFFLALWVTAPFFYNRMIYQHALPGEFVMLAADALALLLFQRLRKMWSWWKIVAIAFLAACSIAMYQAHANLLLTAMLGVCLLEPRASWREVFRDLGAIALSLGMGVALWGALTYGPIVLATLVGVHIPASGGAHDAIYWLTGEHGFRDNLMGFLAGLAINWGYNAFFVVGLRLVLIAVCGMLVASVVLACRRRWGAMAATLCFLLSIFAFPVLQCASAVLRTYYCLVPFIAFSGLALWQWARGRCVARWGVAVALLLAIGAAGHETATLYYFRWKTRELDRAHMATVSRDLWRRYGTAIDRPVAILGGFSHYPTLWQDHRPFRFLPLLSMPFSLYSNVTSHNVPREFYMIARELNGTVLRMPEWDCHQALRARQDEIVSEHPAYPRPGYIFEQEGVVIVNLGKPQTQWRAFRFEDYRSPNEILLCHTLRTEAFAQALLRATRPFRDWAARYPWALER